MINSSIIIQSLFNCLVLEMVLSSSIQKELFVETVSNVIKNHFCGIFKSKMKDVWEKSCS